MVGNASFCSSSRTFDTTNSHSESGGVKRVPGTTGFEGSTSSAAPRPFGPSPRAAATDWGLCSLGPALSVAYGGGQVGDQHQGQEVSTNRMETFFLGMHATFQTGLCSSLYHLPNAGTQASKQGSSTLTTAQDTSACLRDLVAHQAATASASTLRKSKQKKAGSTSTVPGTRTPWQSLETPAHAHVHACRMSPARHRRTPAASAGPA